jgi:L-malate glycosyltransferase
LLDRVRELGVPVITPAAGRSFKGAALAVRVAALTRALRAARVDIVHNYLLRANLVGTISARLARIPVVLCSKRGCHERRGFELISAKIGNRFADRVTVNADAVRDFVHDNEGCPREKMVVIPSGVDTDRFRPLPATHFKARLGLLEARKVVGVVTRMRVRKGVEEFIRAIARLRETQPDVHGVIVGEVSLDESMQTLVRSLGLEAHLSLLGRRSDMPEVLSAFDVFVLSSHDEGMSNAILEAMAMEKPVVATDVGGTAEVVRHGQSGLLVPAKDPEALAVAIGEVLSQPARAREMGRRGRRIVEEGFSAHSMVQQMEHLYLDLLAERGVVAARAAESIV